jgi:hypothetical protein
MSLVARITLPMLDTLGESEGLARSVVSDIARKSFVIGVRTMRTGVMTAWPVSATSPRRQR